MTEPGDGFECLRSFCGCACVCARYALLSHLTEHSASPVHASLLLAPSLLVSNVVRACQEVELRTSKRVVEKDKLQKRTPERPKSSNSIIMQDRVACFIPPLSLAAAPSPLLLDIRCVSTCPLSPLFVLRVTLPSLHVHVSRFRPDHGQNCRLPHSLGCSSQSSAAPSGPRPLLPRSVRPRWGC